MTRILVVEDEWKLARILEAYLREAGFQTERAENGRRALALWRSTRPDMVLLDILLPELDGLEVLKVIRAEGSTPVIMLTARVEEIDTVLGLELGADDYITKPFRPREVLARIKAVLRRPALPAEPYDPPLQRGSLQLDPLKLSAQVGTYDLNPTPVEFRLLYQLARHPGRIYSRSELLEAANPDSDALERTVDSHITNLRRKLEQGGLTEVLQNVRGVGYRFKEPI